MYLEMCLDGAAMIGELVSWFLQVPPASRAAGLELNHRDLLVAVNGGHWLIDLRSIMSRPL